MATTRAFLRDLWALTRPYWFSDERWAARGLLAAVVALNLGIVYINVLLNKWQNNFYNALQDKDMSAFYALLWHFSAARRAPTSCAPCTSSISTRCCRSAGGAGSPTAISSAG